MDVTLISLEIGITLTGIIILLADLWTPSENKARLGWIAIGGLIAVFCYNFNTFDQAAAAINGYSKDGLAVYFQGFFVMAAILVILLTISYAPRVKSGISELYALICFALAGMCFAAGANSFTMLFVAVELITISLYVLTS
ncbi:MAG TPA: proton-translocating NADH-quinone oxidoreductase subunit N, partial [Verrucomicrobiales bacterium]|nr:proton-translocating NADH-quinone oxidoreductase subunit N [Verrucomicrobiales bacterium]